MNFFGGFEGFVDIFFSFLGGKGGHHKIGLYLWVSSMHFRYRMGIFLGGC